jgi:hypothetical protein
MFTIILSIKKSLNKHDVLVDIFMYENIQYCPKSDNLKCLGFSLDDVVELRVDCLWLFGKTL